MIKTGINDAAEKNNKSYAHNQASSSGLGKKRNYYGGCFHIPLFKKKINKANHSKR